MAYNANNDSAQAYKDALKEIVADLYELDMKARNVAQSMKDKGNEEAYNRYTASFEALENAKNYVMKAQQYSSKGAEIKHDDSVVLPKYTLGKSAMGSNTDGVYEHGSIPTEEIEQLVSDIPDVTSDNKWSPPQGMIKALGARF